MSKIVDMRGLKYGKLTILSQRPSNKDGRAVWLCQCECGKETPVVGISLRNGNTQSCGCGLNPLAYASKNKLYDNYKRTCATMRGFDFTLSKEEFFDLTQQNCHYCGSEPTRVAKSPGSEPYLYNGLDRVNNARGYILENVVPCCWQCNLSKRNLSQEEFLDWIKRVYQHEQTKHGE